MKNAIKGFSQQRLFEHGLDGNDAEQLKTNAILEVEFDKKRGSV